MELPAGRLFHLSFRHERPVPALRSDPVIPCFTTGSCDGQRAGYSRAMGTIALTRYLPMVDARF